MKPVIEVENLSKSYKISHQQKPAYHSLVDNIGSIMKRPFGGGARYSRETFWALKDVSFSLNEGEILGIIGQNGSGKSTLLKILSRIVSPSTGSVTIRGQTASLLEVGTGFHPELTGRENIYLNGSILGMSKKEIENKFDEIVSFSEIAKFLDTPVKFYSSGMHVRLAFAVASQLEPEVLIIDEVLAVGDAQFQKKSLARMQAIATEGRTVLFVSHNMATIQSLCTRAIYLDHGKLVVDGTTNKVTEEYKKKVELKTKDTVQLNKRKKDSRVLVSNIVTKNSSNETIKTFSSGEDVIVEVSYRLLDKKLKRIGCAISFDSASTQQIVAYLSADIKEVKIMTSQKKRTITFRIKNLPFNRDKYQLNAVLDDGKGNVLDWVRNSLTIEVVPGDFYGNSQLPPAGMGTTLLDYDVTV